MAWGAEFDPNSFPARETANALFQLRQATLAYVLCKCLLMVLLTSSGKLRMCAEQGGSCACSSASYLKTFSQHTSTSHRRSIKTWLFPGVCLRTCSFLTAFEIKTVC